MDDRKYTIDPDVYTSHNGIDSGYSRSESNHDRINHEANITIESRGNDQRDRYLSFVAGVTRTTFWLGL